jgi:membrane protease YdiL (CAAX protease family)
VLLAAISVPFIEETFFRGIVLGILLRTGQKLLSVIAVSGLFAVVHFLKGAEHESAIVTWISGFQSIRDAFAGFSDPMMVLAAFATLFVQMVAFPWLGKNLLVGIIPLGLAAVTWTVMRLWLKHDRASKI